MVYEQQHIKKITIIAAGSLLLAAAVVFGLMCNGGYSNTYHLQTASAIQDKNTTTSTTNNNTIQLSTKEVKDNFRAFNTCNLLGNDVKRSIFLSIDYHFSINHHLHF